MLNSTHAYFELSEEAQQDPIEIANENEEIRHACLDDIRTWLTEEVPWILARSEDKYVLPFLRECKFNLPKTKEKIIKYYTMKTERPEWFTSRNPLLPELQQLIKMGVCIPLRRPHENRLVLVVRAAAHDPAIHKWDDIIKVGYMIMDVTCQENEYAQNFGAIGIFDMTGMSFSHYLSLTPTFIKKAASAFQNYHLPPKQLEFINAPMYLNIAINILRSFMTTKMKNRVRVHYGGIEKAKEVVSEEILPVDYGGKGESVETLGNIWFEKLLGYRNWFLEDEIYKANN